MIVADEDSPVRDKLAVYYQLRTMLEEWTPTEFNEDTHIILAIRQMIGYSNKHIDPEWD